MPAKKRNASSIEALVGSIMTGGGLGQAAESAQEGVQGADGIGMPPAHQDAQEPPQEAVQGPVKPPAKEGKADATRKVRCTLHLETDIDKALDLRCARMDGLTRSECINVLLRKELAAELKMLEDFKAMMHS